MARRGRLEPASSHGALGGKVTYLEDPPSPPVIPNASGPDAAYNRGWEYWKQIVPMN